MNYINITEHIADENNTTAQEVEKEMKKALEMAGIDIDPDLFISLICSDIRKNITCPALNNKSIRTLH